MKTDSVSFFIRHKGKANCDYIDADVIKKGITTIEAMGLFISRLAGSLQYSDSNDEMCEFEITIEKRI